MLDFDIQQRLDLPDEMYRKIDRPKALRRSPLPHTPIPHLVEPEELSPDIHTNPRGYIDSMLNGITALPVYDGRPHEREIISIDEIKRRKAESINKAVNVLNNKPQTEKDSQEPKPKKMHFRAFSPGSTEWLNRMDQLIYRRLGTKIHEYFFKHLEETLKNSDRPIGELKAVFINLDGPEFDGINEYAKEELIDILSELVHKLQEVIIKRKHDIEAQTGVDMHAFALPNFFLKDTKNTPQFIDGLILYCPKIYKPLIHSFIQKYEKNRKEGYRKASYSLLNALAPYIKEIEMEPFELKTFIKSDEEISPLHSGCHLKQIKGYEETLINEFAKDFPDLIDDLNENIRGVLVNVVIPAVDSNHQVNYIGLPTISVSDVV